VRKRCRRHGGEGGEGLLPQTAKTPRFEANDEVRKVTTVAGSRQVYVM
jgi:hypothetical protein